MKRDYSQPLDPKMVQSLQGMDRPIPGQSLTQDPSNPRAFERPPKFTSLKKAQEEIFSKLIDEEVYVPVMELLESGEATIMEITQNLLYGGFKAGQWNPDLMIMLAEPTAYMLMALAEQGQIDYEIDNEEDEDENEAPLDGRMSKLQETLKKKTPKSFDKTAIPSSIQKRMDEAPVSLLNKSEPVVDEEVPSLMQKNVEEVEDVPA